MNISFHRIDAFLLLDPFLPFGMDFDLVDADAFFFGCDSCVAPSLDWSEFWRGTRIGGVLTRGRMSRFL